MLNKKAIFEALNKRPLCQGHLIKQAGFDKNHVEYCAMGALAADVGATDEYLRHTSSSGQGIWRDFGLAIRAKFGIESYEQFASLMSVNDAESFNTRRNKRVMDKVEAMSPEEVDAMIEDVVREELPVSTKTESGE